MQGDIKLNNEQVDIEGDLVKVTSPILEAGTIKSTSMETGTIKSASLETGTIKSTSLEVFKIGWGESDRLFGIQFLVNPFGAGVDSAIHLSTHSVSLSTPGGKSGTALSVSEGDTLVLNQNAGFTGGVRLEGDVEIPEKLQIGGITIEKGKYVDPSVPFDLSDNQLDIRENTILVKSRIGMGASGGDDIDDYPTLDLVAEVRRLSNDIGVNKENDLVLNPESKREQVKVKGDLEVSQKLHLGSNLFGNITLGSERLLVPNEDGGGGSFEIERDELIPTEKNAQHFLAVLADGIRLSAPGDKAGKHKVEINSSPTPLGSPKKGDYILTVHPDVISVVHNSTGPSVLARVPGDPIGGYKDTYSMQVTPTTIIAEHQWQRGPSQGGTETLDLVAVIKDLQKRVKDLEVKLSSIS